MEHPRLPVPDDVQTSIEQATHRQRAARRSTALRRCSLDRSDRASARAPPGADHRRRHGRARHPRWRREAVNETALRGRDRGVAARPRWLPRASRPSQSADFDPALGLDTAELFAFIGATQATAVGEAGHGSRRRRSSARAGFVKRLAAAARRARHGRCAAPRRRGPRRRRSGWRTSSPRTGSRRSWSRGTTPNRLTVTRQLPLRADSTKTLDLCLFVNGIPVATAELKNPLTGQTVEHAIEPVPHRPGPEERHARRAGARALRGRPRAGGDDDAARRAARRSSCRSTSGHDGRRGQPAEPGRAIAPSYLWEQVWQRDAWLDLLAPLRPRRDARRRGRRGQAGGRARSSSPATTSGTPCSSSRPTPREHGAGQNYLVQHSAGSGKSNTIAWLAHRLSTLHDAADHKVFDKVVVITDRVVLDRQLQDTIYQFEHATAWS